jgi:hypothetical protein
VEEIAKTQWRGRHPVGPFGSYVTVREARWVPLMRSQLGWSMSSFLVENSWDFWKLKKIFIACKWFADSVSCKNLVLLIYSLSRIPSIIMSRFDQKFDFSGGEPPPEYNTVLRVLNVCLFARLTMAWLMQYTSQDHRSMGATCNHQ